MQRQFLLDVMLGKLATYLRMCGYDTVYSLDADLEADEAIKQQAAASDRTLVTRDTQLAERTPRAILLESTEIESQLAELSAAGIMIALPTEPRRCSVCNGRVREIDPDNRPDHAPDDISPVWRCEACEQCFWKGSHWDRVAATVEAVSEPDA